MMSYLKSRGKGQNVLSFHSVPDSTLAGPSTTNQRPCPLPPSQPTAHTLTGTGHQTVWRPGGPFSSDPTPGTYWELILVRPMALTWTSLSFPNSNSSSPPQWPIRSAHMCLARLRQLILSLYQRGISNNPITFPPSPRCCCSISHMPASPGNASSPHALLPHEISHIPLCTLHTSTCTHPNTSHAYPWALPYGNPLFDQ